MLKMKYSLIISILLVKFFIFFVSVPGTSEQPKEKYGITNISYYDKKSDGPLPINYSIWGDSLMLVDFKGPSGKYRILNFTLISSKGDSVPPLAVRHAIPGVPVAKWQSAITTFINQIYGDVNLSLIFKNISKPFSEFKLLYEDKIYKVISPHILKENINRKSKK